MGTVAHLIFLLHFLIEMGQYLALDLGGTNYRLLLVNFHAPQTPPTIEADVYTISPELQTGSGSEVR